MEKQLFSIFTENPVNGCTRREASAPLAVRRSPTYDSYHVLCPFLRF